MNDRALLIISADDVARALGRRERETIAAVQDAYVGHERRGPSPALSDDDGAVVRLAQLPDDAVTGVEWIMAREGQESLARRSAVLLIQSPDRPLSIMESSCVRAHRTAAMAALAARVLHQGDDCAVSLIGCGVVNFEVLRYLRAVWPDLERVVLHDPDPWATRRFMARIERELPGISFRAVRSIEQAFRAARLVSIATTTAAPYVHSTDGLAPDSTVLHLSLRDLSPAVMREVDNVTDDVELLQAEPNSPGLRELDEDGTRARVRCSLAEVLRGAAPARAPGLPVVFSPVGPAVLDLAVAQQVLAHSFAGVEMRGFLPATPVERMEYRRALGPVSVGAAAKLCACQMQVDDDTWRAAVWAGLEDCGEAEVELWSASLDGEQIAIATIDVSGAMPELVDLHMAPEYLGLGVEDRLWARMLATRGG